MAKTVAYARNSIIEGDQVDGITVLGFGFSPGDAAELGGRDNDRLLLEGDRLLTQLPDRRVPDVSDRGIQYTATLPAQRLPHGREVDLHDGLDDDVSALLQRQDRRWSDFIGAIVEDLHQAGHVVWLAGGGVRDLVASRDTARVNDLDMAGTAPAGQFTEIAYRRLALAGKAHYRQKVSNRLICSIRDHGQSLVEYKALHQNGFRFPATGADLEVDARSRDFTVNALFYDPVREQLLDPCGQGMADLMARPRRLISLQSLPYRDSSLAVAAAIVLRTIKFLHRWRGEGIDVDETNIRAWIGRLSAGSWDLPQQDWVGLRRTVEQLAENIPAASAYEIAESLGAAAVDLLNRLMWRH